MLHLKLREPADSPSTNRARPTLGCLFARLGTIRGRGAMVDIGLGPTYGVFYFELSATKRSPRRVQTDAYHRP